jgi:hypothetical protein
VLYPAQAAAQLRYPDIQTGQRLMPLAQTLLQGARVA